MKLKLVINRCYHVTGWKTGTFFRLIAIEGDVAVLERPKFRRKKKFRVPVDSLIDTKRHAPPQTKVKKEKV